MYHDTIHINFKSSYQPKEIDFDYSFLISKKSKDKFSPIKYNELLKKFTDLEFDLKYLKFYDIDEDAIVFCTYNYQPNFEIFFTAYNRIIRQRFFDITFEYGNIINGKFFPNNMNFFAGIHFVERTDEYGKPSAALYMKEVINGRYHIKKNELYQIVDKNGNLIYCEVATANNDFEQHFFEQYDVKVALRKYKLERLKNSFNEDD
jgi:hypothetical protein